MTGKTSLTPTSGVATLPSNPSIQSSQQNQEKKVENIANTSFKFFGAHPNNGKIRFRVYAPNAKKIRVVLPKIVTFPPKLHHS